MSSSVFRSTPLVKTDIWRDTVYRESSLVACAAEWIQTWLLPGTHRRRHQAPFRKSSRSRNGTPLRCGHGVRAPSFAQPASSFSGDHNGVPKLAPSFPAITRQVNDMPLVLFVDNDDDKLPCCHSVFVRRYRRRQLRHLPQPYHGPLHRVPSTPTVRNF